MNEDAFVDTPVASAGDGMLAEAEGEASARQSIAASGGERSIVVAAEVVDRTNIGCKISNIYYISYGKQAKKQQRGAANDEARARLLLAPSKLAEALNPALEYFAGREAVAKGATEEDLFLAQRLDGLYRAFWMQLPPREIDGLPPEEMEEIVSDLRSHVTLLANYIKSTGLDARLNAAYVQYQKVCDKFQEVITERRRLSHERGIAHRQAMQDHRQEQEEKQKGKTFSGSEVISKTFEFYADLKRIELKIDLEYKGKDLKLQQKFENFFDNARADAAAKMLELAQTYTWGEEQFCFDADSDLWEQIRKLTFQQQFSRRAELLEVLLERRPGDLWVTMFFIHNVAPVTDEDRALHVNLAARGALLIPGASVYDMDRVAFLVLVARRSLEILRASESGKKFGSGDVSHAAHIAEIWRVWKEHQPDFCPEEVLEGRVFSLASADKLREAWEVAAHHGKTPFLPALTYTMVRLMSRVGELDHALEWLKYGLNREEVELALCRKDADLAALREGRASQFTQLTTVHCDVTCDPGSLWDKVTLVNQSAFPLHGLHLTVHKADRTRMVLDAREAVDANGSYIWRLPLIRLEGSRGQVHPISFGVKCAEAADTQWVAVPV